MRNCGPVQRAGFICVILIAFVAIGVACAQDAVTAEKTEYQGWKNNLRMGNGEAELIVTMDVGPRIICYRLAKGDNVFKEFADQLGKSGERDWQSRGGHRLWIAPEDLTRTYFPDNGPVAYRRAGDRFSFSADPERPHGIQKELTVRLAATGSRVTLEHSIKNVGARATTVAPCGVSVMAPGGLEIIPLPPKAEFPGPPANANSEADYAPNQRLALWPYFDFRDDRFAFGGRYITLRQIAHRGPTQIGVAHRMGWVAYLNEKTLFVKRFKYEDGKTYPDTGCNFETFCSADALEMRTLGPLVTLRPGESTKLTEYWELIPNVEPFKGESGIDLNVLPKVTREKD